MKKEINLKEVLYSKIPESIQNDGWSFGDIDENWILDAMKEACKQTLELAAENVLTKPIYVKNCDDHAPYWGACGNCGRYDNPDIKIGDKIDKQSILDTINQMYSK